MWALIFISLIGRSQEPKYGEIFQTRAECIRQMNIHAKEHNSFLSNEKFYCIPIEHSSKK